MMGNAQAYHLNVKDAEPSPTRGFGFSELDALFVPDRSILMGYATYSRTEGQIVSYPFMPIFIDRFLAMMGNPSQGTASGKVVSKPILTSREIQGLKRNYDNSLINRSFNGTSIGGRMIYLSQPFDGTTPDLIKILSSNIFENRLITHSLRLVLGWQRQPIAQPQTQAA